MFGEILERKIVEKELQRHLMGNLQNFEKNSLDNKNENI